MPRSVLVVSPLCLLGDAVDEYARPSVADNAHVLNQMTEVKVNPPLHSPSTA